MKIALGSDHAGYELKECIKTFLVELGYEVNDFGAFDEEPTDYPDMIRPAAECVARGEADLGIVFGGSGNGEAIAANKVRGIRCALCWSVESAQLARQHNDANVIALGGRLVTPVVAKGVVNAWLSTEFEGGRHACRIAKLEA